MPNGDGLGGAGAPLGGSFTGPAQTLDIYGDFAMATSGELIVNNTTVTAFEFTTGNYLFVGKLQQGTVYTSIGNGTTVGLLVYLNGSLVMQNVETVRPAGTGADQDVTTLDILIPPYTVVKTQASTSDIGNNEFYQILVGRIYRG